MLAPDPIPESPSNSLIAPTTSWISRPPSPAATIPPSSVARSSHPQGDFTFVASGSLLVGTIQLGDRLYKTSTSPTAGCGCSKSIPKKCRRIDPPPYRPWRFPARCATLNPCLSNRQSGPSAIRPDRSMSSSVYCAPMRSGSSSMSATIPRSRLQSAIQYGYAGPVVARGRDAVSPSAGVGRFTKTEEGFVQSTDGATPVFAGTPTICRRKNS